MDVRPHVQDCETNLIHVENLTKSFGDLMAVAGIGFRIAPGEIYGLLGPNGAGKTTTLSMLAGLMKPDGGRIRYAGVDLFERPLEVKARLGVVPQENALYEDLSAREHLELWSGLYGLRGVERRQAVHRMLDQVGLLERAGEPVRGFSGGMKRRLNLAIGLVHGPRAVLLDEPTVGIDPQARLNILEVIRGVAARGTAVLYTTHYLEEAEQICDRLAILDQGRILAEGTLEELQSQAGAEEVVAVRGPFDTEELVAALNGREGIRILAREDGHVAFATSVRNGRHRSMELVADLLAGEVPLEGVSIEPPSLHALFLKLTGRELRDG